MNTPYIGSPLRDGDVGFGLVCCAECSSQPKPSPNNHPMKNPKAITFSGSMGTGTSIQTATILSGSAVSGGKHPQAKSGCRAVLKKMAMAGDGIRDTGRLKNRPTKNPSRNNHRLRSTWAPQYLRRNPT